MKWKSAVATAALAAGIPAVAGAQGVGAFSVDVPAQADTRVSVPFANQPFGEFEVQSVSGNTATLAGADFSGEFPLNSQGNASYYVRFTTGALAGRWFNIVGQDSDSVSLNIEDTGNPADLSSVDPGDELVVIQHLTVEQVFPDNLEGLSFSASPDPFNVAFVLRLPGAADGTGTNLAATTELFYDGSRNAWFTLAGTPADDFVIEPQSTIVLNNSNPVNTGSPDDPSTVVDESTGSLQFPIAGIVLDTPIAEGIPEADIANDTLVGANNLFAVALPDSGLSDVIAESPDPFNVTDIVQVFEVPEPGDGFNLASSKEFFLSGGDFFNLDGTLANDVDIEPGQVLRIRKQPGTPGELAIWNVTP